MSGRSGKDKRQASIVQVESGRKHSLCLVSEGWVYSWGSNEKYQLGRESGEGSDARPGLVPLKRPDGKFIPCVQVACGRVFNNCKNPGAHAKIYIIGPLSRVDI